MLNKNTEDCDLTINPKPEEETDESETAETAESTG